MKKLTHLLAEYIVVVCFGVFVVCSRLVAFAPGLAITDSFSKFFLEMISFIPFMFILIGLFDVWVPREKIEQHIGEDSGVKGMFLVILLAMLQAGPLYGAFPIAYLLWKKGSSIRNIFIYLGAFSTIKIPMLSFEIGFLGWKFSLLRTAITLPFFLLIGEIMSRYLKNRNFEIRQPERTLNQ